MIGAALAWASIGQPATAAILPAIDRADRAVQGAIGILPLGLGLATGTSVDVRVLDGLTVGACYYLFLAPLAGGEQYRAVRLTQRLWSKPNGAAIGVTASYGVINKGGHSRAELVEVQPALNVALPLTVVNGYPLVLRMTYGPTLTLSRRSPLAMGDETQGVDDEASETATSSAAAELPVAFWNLNPELAMPVNANLEFVISGTTGWGVRALW